MMRAALYPGSFDPVTRGHLDIIMRGTKLFDLVIVGVATNISKRPMFDLEQRVAFIEHATRDIEAVEVSSLDGLLVDEASRLGCVAILRGVRNAADFDYESRMTLMNARLAPKIETTFLMASPEYVFVSSSLIKEVARFGGSIEGLVPSDVERALHHHLRT